MSTLAKAIMIAAIVFEKKTDKAGQPYILHCLRVMEGVGRDEIDQTIAVLHDVAEDTHLTIDNLRYHGFSEEILSALELLNHKKEVPYMDYIKQLSHNPRAVRVKMADLRDNSQITRLKGLRKKDFERIEKYHTAYVYLSN